MGRSSNDNPLPDGLRPLGISRTVRAVDNDRDAFPAASEPALPPARRYLTLFFSDLCDSTAIGEAMEAEHYAALLEALRDACRRVIPKYGGQVVRIQGDGVLAIFGHPDAREDDGRRAADAALELHAAVRALRIAQPLPLHSTLALHTGIHAGLVLVDTGDLMRGRFDLTGKAANIAARLSALAERDQILVSEDSLGPHGGFFRTGARQLLALKGREGTVACVTVEARASVLTRFDARPRSGLAPFVGRTPELATLERHLASLQRGEPQLVAVSAGAGLGKTRLVDEFLSRAAARGCQVLRGGCEGYLGAEPLHPFLQILAELFGLSGDLPVAEAIAAVEHGLQAIDPELLAMRPELLRALSIGATEPRKGNSAGPTVAALGGLFSALAAQRPLLLFLDDWQWADDASNQVLSGLRTLELPIFVLMATRGFSAGDASMSGADILEINPLSEPEAVAAMLHLAPNIDPFIGAEIRRYAGGNPLYLEELCHSAAHPESPLRAGRMFEAAGWLNSLVESRVARLPADQAELVRVAAVIGNDVPAWLLQTISGVGEGDATLRGLAEHDFVFPGERAGMLRFKHGITRDVVYQTVGLHAREQLHLRIAQALQDRSARESPEQAYEALAYHFEAAGRWDEAARYAELSGDKAVAASALDRAKAQYRAALAALDRLPPGVEVHERWTSIAQRLGFSCVFDASREELHVFERAVVIARARGDQRAIARAEYWLGYIHYAVGQLREATTHCERALEAVAMVNDEPLRVQIRATLGQIHQAASQYAPALTLLNEAIAIKRRFLSGTRPAVGFAYSVATQATLLADHGRFREAQECFDESLEGVTGTHHEVEASINGLRAAVYLWQGRWEDAIACSQRAMRVAERVRSLFSFSMSHAAGSYAQWMLDGRMQSLQSLASATSWLEPRRIGLFRSWNFGWLADALVTTGHYREARHQAARALMRERSLDHLGVAMAYRALARGESQQGRHAAAQRYLAHAMRIADQRESQHELATTRWCAAAIELERPGGDPGRAASLLADACEAFEAMEMRWHLERANRLRASISSD